MVKFVCRYICTLNFLGKRLSMCADFVGRWIMDHLNLGLKGSLVPRPISQLFNVSRKLGMGLGTRLVEGGMALSHTAPI